MLRVVLPILLVFVVLPNGARAQNSAPDTQACEAAAEFTQPNETLVHLQAALVPGGIVHVLAIGSGTTVGEVNGTPGASFPYRMLETLQAARPNVSFDLTVRGGRNMTAEAMLGILKEELARQHYPLVLWQTGTVEAVRGMRPDMMREVLQQGVDAVQAQDGDVILVDPQFSRFLRANADLDPYESVLQQVATLPGVELFRRFELMRGWANDGRIDLERVGKPDRDKAVELLNKCLGTTLAEFVLAGTESSTR